MDPSNTTPKDNWMDNNVLLAALIVSIVAIVTVVFIGISFMLYVWRRKSGQQQEKKGSPIFAEMTPASILHSKPTLSVDNENLTSPSVFIGVGNLRKIAIGTLQDMLQNLHNVRTKIDCRDTSYRSDTQLPMNTAADLETIKSYLSEKACLVYKCDNGTPGLFQTACEQIINATSVKQLVDAIHKICRYCVGTVKEWGADQEPYVGLIPAEGPGHFKFSYDNQGTGLKLAWDSEKFSQSFMDTVSQVLQALRDERRQPTPIEYIALQLAYHNIHKGTQVTFKPSRCLGSPGFRPHTQTYMSLTDPGEGHILGTTRFNEWMLGAIVHVEHLERPGHLPREKIESYRIPSLHDFAKVRLHVGSSAPTTYFVGRRMKDCGSFDEDFLKLVHITSASASAAFYQGAAECKVSMEGLTTRQAVKYMNAFRAQVHRDRLKQFLSAAWNLNQTVTDDYDKKSTTLTERIDIARRAIEVTSIGGFDKVTWDGASDTYPSKCIMYQLSFEEALTIVHEAHMCGLVTYFSAGFKFDEIKLAVYTGVDGIGIGGAQVLRFMDKDSGMHGPYTEENIARILKNRDDAAQSWKGRGVHLLARLDTMFFEGSITRCEDTLRNKMFNALIKSNEGEVSSIFGQLEWIARLPSDDNSLIPQMGAAKRILNSKQPVLKEVCDELSEWKLFTDKLRRLVDTNNESGMAEEYEGEPWLKYRKKYRVCDVASKRRFSRQVSFTMNYKA